MEITCTRRISFCAGHRVRGHENKCARLHGHQYEVLIAARAASLDAIGRVIDFSVLKEKIGGWIDREWDHGFILYDDDEAYHALIETEPHRIFLLPTNPTAENIADYLLRVVCPRELAATNVQVVEVTVWETPNCYATARLSD